ncbi:2-succinylbenzoate--CoA ligase [Anabaena sp. UHCC 0399]|uniref:2-succinylbenzoate--CoA ligase n=1 Tax=Anabaena sp. UHCC 0399 TaxID=3110238 RepID=UPI002B1F764E|nr:2-succinylbenzoate--CoA ligase [Anabaena sp. UHCC 0399]MEA5565262.1 2-succinylbenzoate--CoA ligase [Anabaena sp. UHCC 0399]
MHHDLLIGDDNQELQQLATKLYAELTQLSTDIQPLKIILAEREPVRFLAGFIAACAANCQVFLCNPDWGEQEWHQVFNLVQPDIIWGIGTGDWRLGTGKQQGCREDKIPIHNSSLTTPHSQLLTRNSSLATPHSQLSTHNSTLIMISTGGSSGKIKFAMHTWETLTASVQGFTEYFQLQQVNSVCVLPLYHVSGLMQFMRAVITGGKIVILPFKSIELAQKYQINPQDFFISLVPTQLQRLFQNQELTAWLAKFKTVLLGGAPAGDELLEKAKFHCIHLSPTYGMTETASQIVTLKPDDFLSGKTGSGQILPHAKVKICNPQREVLSANQRGIITIQAKSLALGYYPYFWNNQDDFSVDDVGFLDEQGYLKIVGRNGDKIISGGENIYPIEIESAILSTQMVIDVCVIGIPDQDWGQALTAIYIPKNTDINSGEIKNILANQLSRFKIPKYWISLDTLPRNAQGKVNRQTLQKIATEFLRK